MWKDGHSDEKTDERTDMVQLIHGVRDYVNVP